MDVDFIHEVVVIDHQLLKSKEQGYYIEKPKTKSGTRQVPKSGTRQVPLSRETIQAFQRVMKKLPKAEPFVIDGRGNFLFVNHKGKPKVAIDYNMLFVRMVKKYNKHHKDNPLPHITPHTLRHTFCTRLASKNMNPKDLQYIMGHSNIPLSRETIQAFQRVMKKLPKAEPFVIDGRGNFLFVNHKGKPKVAIDYNMLFVRMVQKYNKHHKDNPLPHITPHTLRHTFCTRLASKNMNPKDLQYIMGHSNISITMNWYAHASIDTAKSEVQRLIA